MGDIEPWLETVARTALTFRERLEAHDHDIWSVELEQAWLDAVAGSDVGWLTRRQSWSRDRSTAAQPVPSEATDHAGWVEVVQEISRAAALDAPDVEATHASSPGPFAPLLLPIVEVARRRLRLRVDESCRSAACVSAGAMAQLETDLYERLLTVAGRVLDLELARVRPPGRALLLTVGAAMPPAGHELYAHFIGRHRASGWRLLFERYPMLARLMATTVLFWVEASAELLERLAVDRAALSALGVPPGVVVEGLQPSVSDRHRGGRTAVIVTFDGGARVVFKPKPVQAEGLVAATIEWLNARGLTPGLLPNPVLVRDGYGWAAFVEHRPCSSPAEVRTYFTRAGMLLCLLHVLRTTDAHYENIVAVGDQPVLVDCETILYPDPRPLVPHPGVDVSDPLLATVLRTGLLPCWQEVNGRPYDSSGLSGLDGSNSTIATWQWTDVGTDDMRLELVPEPPHILNRVLLHGRPVAAEDHDDAVVDGFLRCYDLLLQHRDGLLAAGGPLHGCRGTPIRFIFRPTRVYGAVLAGSLAPELLTDGVAFGLHLDALASAFLSGEQKPDTWPVLAAETRALERLDVPIFTLDAGATGLALDDGTVLEDVFETDTALGVATALMSLSVEDRGRQAGLISAAFRARTARPPTERGQTRAAGRDDQPWDSAAVLELARRIGAGLLDSALPTGDGGLTWVGPSLLEAIGYYRLGLVGTGLYDGTSGIAIFLGALGQVTGEARFGDAALAALHRTRQRSDDPGGGGVSDYGASRGLGIAAGLGGDLYALASVGRWLGDAGADLAKDAETLASLVLPAALSQDESFDVMSGSAGALLGLLSLYETTGSELILTRAIESGDYLLEQRSVHRGHRVWVTVSGRALTGFSHGAAGIGYALARLHAASALPRFMDAALEAVGYERACFDPVQGNWPDLRPNGVRDPSGFCVKWCHGAAGIAIGRVGMLNFAAVEGAHEEIAVAARTTANRLLQHEDYLCCGNFGRIEALLVASQAIPDSHWQKQARAAATSIVHSSRRNGFHVNGIGERENPSFFQGMSGIGYQLLRLARPELPSVLLLD